MIDLQLHVKIPKAIKKTSENNNSLESWLVVRIISNHLFLAPEADGWTRTNCYKWLRPQTQSPELISPPRPFLSNTRARRVPGRARRVPARVSRRPIGACSMTCRIPSRTWEQSSGRWTEWGRQFHRKNFGVA